MEKSRRGYRAIEPPMAEPSMAEPPMAEPPMAEPPMAEPPMAEPPVAEPIEKPMPITVAAEHSGGSPLETSAAGAAALPDMTGPAAVDQTAAEEPAVAVPPPILAAAPSLAAPQHKAADFSGEAMAALAEARGALADGVEALSEEVAGLARRSIETAARSAIDMLAVKTIGDAFAVNAGFARASLSNWLGSSAKLSELGLRLAAESARPFAERLAAGRIGVLRTSP